MEVKVSEGNYILLVDDDLPLINSFKSILKNKGYIVESSSTGKRALNKAEKTKFDLAILDIVLPDIRADELAMELKKKNRNTVIILITGLPHFQDCIDILDLGIYDILLKPISPDELLKICRDALSTNKNKTYWMGKSMKTKKAVMEYRILKKKGYDVSLHKISKKYGYSPVIATIQEHVSGLKKRDLW